MTSKQIKATKKGNQAFWLRELSLQFAEFNERNAAVDEYNAKADDADAKNKVKSQSELSLMIKKGMEVLTRIGAPYEPPTFAPAPPKEQ